MTPEEADELDNQINKIMKKADPDDGNMCQPIIPAFISIKKYTGKKIKLNEIGKVDYK